jgi:adenylosuccinate lyase
MLSLLGSIEKVASLEKKVATYFGFNTILDSPGQVYFRSLDSELLYHLSLLSDACSNYAIGMRLMSGEGLVTEGFKEGQVGSSAMPHKMNTRSSERINGLSKLVKMYSDGASRVSGDQWEEGDVSCSSPRRVIIPDSFYASDGLCETTLTVLNDMGIYPYMIAKEVETFLPFLASTQILMEAVKAGIGREKAHKIIKKHSVAEALRMRQEGAIPDVLGKLAEEPDFKAAGITLQKLNMLIKEKNAFVGNAYDQIMSMKAKAQPLLEKYSAEAKYEPLEIL